MKHKNIFLIVLGIFSILFQIFHIKTYLDTICFISTILILFLIIYAIKTDKLNIYNYFYKYFSNVAILIFINNIIIYLNIPSFITITLKLILTILILKLFLHLFRYKYNFF